MYFSPNTPSHRAPVHEASINLKNTWLADANGSWAHLWKVVYVDDTQGAEKLNTRFQKVVKIKTDFLVVLIF